MIGVFGENFDASLTVWVGAKAWSTHVVDKDRLTARPPADFDNQDDADLPILLRRNDGTIYPTEHYL